MQYVSSETSDKPCLQNVLKDFPDLYKSAVLFALTRVNKDTFKTGGSYAALFFIAE